MSLLKSNIDLEVKGVFEESGLREKLCAIDREMERQPRSKATGRRRPVEAIAVPAHVAAEEQKDIREKEIAELREVLGKWKRENADAEERIEAKRRKCVEATEQGAKNFEAIKLVAATIRV
jgi:hypothetical protein